MQHCVLLCHLFTSGCFLVLGFVYFDGHLVIVSCEIMGKCKSESEVHFVGVLNSEFISSVASRYVKDGFERKKGRGHVLIL